jgi:acetyl-CoA acyltransferase 1
MSLGNMANAVDPSLISEAVFENEDAKKCLIPMGITSENVAAKWGISRQVQDQMAADSHAKAVRAQNMGYYDEGTPSPEATNRC